MKRTIIFTMFVLCLFGAVAVANAATELTEDQMARQFGGTFLDPETNCYPYQVADQYVGTWFYGCTDTGEECSHNDNTSNYVCVCACVHPSGIFYYICKNDDDGYDFDPDYEYIWTYDSPNGPAVVFDEDTYPISGGYPPYSL